MAAAVSVRAWTSAAQPAPGRLAAANMRDRPQQRHFISGRGIERGMLRSAPAAAAGGSSRRAPLLPLRRASLAWAFSSDSSAPPLSSIGATSSGGDSGSSQGSGKGITGSLGGSEALGTGAQDSRRDSSPSQSSECGAAGGGSGSGGKGGSSSGRGDGSSGSNDGDSGGEDAAKFAAMLCFLCTSPLLILAALDDMDAWLTAGPPVEEQLAGSPGLRLSSYYPIPLHEAVAVCAAYLTGEATTWPSFPPSKGGGRLEKSPLTGRPRVVVPPHLLKSGPWAPHPSKLDVALKKWLANACPGESTKGCRGS